MKAEDREKIEVVITQLSAAVEVWKSREESIKTLELIPSEFGVTDEEMAQALASLFATCLSLFSLILRLESKE